MRETITSPELRAALGMSERAFEDFKQITRQTHRRYRRTSATPSARSIADPTITWNEIPSALQRAMANDVIRRCGHRKLFPAMLAMDVIETTVVHRLAVVRRQWQSGLTREGTQPPQPPGPQHQSQNGN